MSCIKDTTRGCCFSRDDNGQAHAHNCPGCHKLEVFDWMADLPDPLASNQIFEVQFKNTHKGYFINDSNLPLQPGDIVAVEASPGHDIGIISLAGELVTRQMKKTGFNPQGVDFRKIYRKAKPGDIEKWQEAIAREHATMIRSRQITADLRLNMKIGDVEFQGDGMRAIFYYIADERVDFRELIKILADQFRIRVEMRQIGARQEAGRIGGIAPCGRELCCSTWLGNFSSVTIGAARHQEITPNPQKLGGQCGKLKCCLNYELDVYLDARQSIPKINGPLEALDGSYYLVKTDIFERIMWFSPDPKSSLALTPLSVERVLQIVAVNRRGEKVDQLEDKTAVKEKPQFEEPEIKNVVGEESITRFDSQRGADRGRNRSRGGRNRGRGRGDGNGRNENNSGRGDGNGRNNEGGGRNEHGGRNEGGAAKSHNASPGQPRQPQQPRHTARPEQQNKPAGENRPTARPEQTAPQGGGRPNQGHRNRGRGRGRSGGQGGQGSQGGSSRGGEQQ